MAQSETPNLPVPSRPGLIARLVQSLMDFVFGPSDGGAPDPEVLRLVEERVEQLLPALPTSEQVALLADLYPVSPDVITARWRTLGIRRAVTAAVAEFRWGEPAIAEIAARWGVTDAEVRQIHAGSGPEPLPAFPALEAPQIFRPGITVGDVDQVIVCIDLGTSASAVARMDGTSNPHLARFYDEDEKGRPRAIHVIESDIAFPRPEHADAAGPAVLGREAVRLESDRDPAYDFYRSFKRMLTDTPRSDTRNAYYSAETRLAPRVAAMVEELLLLAILPEHSGTIGRVRQRHDAERAAQILSLTGFESHSSVADRIARGSLQLHISIPNAFGNFEERIIRRAAEAAAGRLIARCADLVGEDERGAGDVSVSLVREAEAVVWWTHRIRPSPDGEENWMVFDVGGGSTDSAVVTVRTRSGRPSVRLQMHSGAPFAGGDMDALFLRLAAAAAGDASEAAITARIAAERGSKVQLMGTFSNIKINWSARLEQWLDDLTAEERDAFYGWVIWPEEGDVEELLLQLPELRVLGSPWHTAVLEPRSFAVAYARFLRGVVVGLVGSLREQAEQSGGGLRLDRVIISGRGSRIAGVRPLLERELKRLGWIAKATDVGFVPRLDEADRDHLKLACVRGIAIGAVCAPMEGILSHILSDEVTFSLGARPLPLWSRRMPLRDGVVRGVLRLRHDPEDWNPGTFVHFHQARCPPQVVKAVSDADDRWAYRHLGFISLDLVRDIELYLIFNSETWTLQIWDRAVIAEGSGAELRARVGGGGQVANPLTGLPFGWENPDYART